MPCFHVRLIANRPDFARTMTAADQAVMGEHVRFLGEQLAAGALVIAGPVLASTGAYGMAVFEAASLEAVQALMELDPARAIGRHEVSPMGPSVVRPKPAAP